MTKITTDRVVMHICLWAYVICYLQCLGEAVQQSWPWRLSNLPNNYIHFINIYRFPIKFLALF